MIVGSFVSFAVEDIHLLADVRFTGLSYSVSSAYQEMDFG